jgi:DtxR family Mn-dependent transcriptional regulator
MVLISRLMLEEATVGRTYKVIGVKDSSPEFLQYLKMLDVGIGTSITVKEKINFDNSMMIQIGENRQTTVSRVFSQNLLICE